MNADKSVLKSMACDKQSGISDTYRLEVHVPINKTSKYFTLYVYNLLITYCKKIVHGKALSKDILQDLLSGVAGGAGGGGSGGSTTPLCAGRSMP